MIQPTPCMMTVGVMMGPVHDTPFCIPRVHTVEINMITDLQVVDSWRKIDVVSDEKRLIRTQPDNEPLMSAALIIVG